jgi:DNA invertase Pin-like site-specific DNA recombinase
LQYGLQERARELGFQEVEVIDVDLGSSASVGAEQRQGFDRLIGMVARDEVGLVLSWEASRLSRTDKDWRRLLEVCQLFSTLIADGDQIYDLQSADDQLVLGIKGTLSVVELNTLKRRLVEGMRAKARRGELARLLPAGYVRDGLGQVVKDPDLRVQEAIGLVFEKFDELRSVRQTFLWFHAQGVELPVNRPRGTRHELVWQLPKRSYVGTVLHNAFYAGAYVWGQRPVEKRVVDGRVLKRQGRVLPPEQCEVLIRDHHEGYVSWEKYQENLGLMRANYLKMESDQAVTAVRAGRGILSGILRCGRCGRRLYVRYRGRQGTSARYLCKGDYDAGGRYCLAFGGSMADRRFGEELVKVLSPWGLEASREAAGQLSRDHDQRREALSRQREQLEYEARRAFEQYDGVDPRNRLVAGELERRWNQKLEEIERVKATLAEMEREEPALTDSEREELEWLGEHFSQVWESSHCSVQVKKRIIRAVVEEIIVEEKPDTNLLRFVIHWKGGSHSEYEMMKPLSGAGGKTVLEDVEVIRRLAVRYGDDEIANVLNHLGRRTGRGKRWSMGRVAAARRRYSIPGRKTTLVDEEVLSTAQAAKHCGVSEGTIKRLVGANLLNKEQVVPWAPWEIRRQDLDAEPVRSIVEHLRRTDKLVLRGGSLGISESLFQ